MPNAKANGKKQRSGISKLILAADVVYSKRDRIERRNETEQACTMASRARDFMSLFLVKIHLIYI